MNSKNRRCIAVLYPNKPGVTFNFEYYRDHHATLIKRLYGEGIAKIELRRGVATQDNSPVPFIAVINIWIGSQTLFDEAGAKHGATLVEDLNTRLVAGLSGMPALCKYATSKYATPPGDELSVG
ncbi:MAG TPA: hypothetical protein VGL34_18490 [Steroidobacteraceae bacterium]